MGRLNVAVWSAGRAREAKKINSSGAPPPSVSVRLGRPPRAKEIVAEIVVRWLVEWGKTGIMQYAPQWVALPHQRRFGHRPLNTWVDKF